MAKVNTLKIHIITANVGYGGTDDKVWFDTGKYRFRLNTSGDPFERGNEDIFTLSVPAGMDDTDIWRLLICKSPDGSNGGWKLAGIKVKVNSNLIYNKMDINQWLEDESTREWLSPNFVPTGTVPSSLIINENELKDLIVKFFNDLFKGGQWNNLTLNGNAKVDVECEYISIKQSFEAHVEGVNPDVNISVKFIPYVINGKAALQMQSFNVEVDFPDWLEVLSFGIANIVEYGIEDKIRPNLKTYVKEQLQNFISTSIPSGIVKKICLRPNKVEIFY